MTHPDFRSLCAEHLKAWDSDKKYAEDHNALVALIEQTRAALAAPQQGAPSDEELGAFLVGRGVLYNTEGPYSLPSFSRKVRGRVLTAVVREAITRYGAQAAPVAVAWNEVPSDEGADSQGRRWCYTGSHPHPSWQFRKLEPNVYDTHWLPHWALPLPEAQP